MHNYDEVARQPGAMTLRPFEAIWWLQNSLQLASSPARIALPGFTAYAQLTRLFC